MTICQNATVGEDEVFETDCLQKKYLINKFITWQFVETQLFFVHGRR